MRKPQRKEMVSFGLVKTNKLFDSDNLSISFDGLNLWPFWPFRGLAGLDQFCGHVLRERLTFIKIDMVLEQTNTCLACSLVYLSIVV